VALGYPPTTDYLPIDLLPPPKKMPQENLCSTHRVAPEVYGVGQSECEVENNIPYRRGRYCIGLWWSWRQNNAALCLL